MEELLDMITSNESPSEISDKIKNLLFAKSAERVDNFRPSVSAGLFGDEDSGFEQEEE